MPKVSVITLPEGMLPAPSMQPTAAVVSATSREDSWLELRKWTSIGKKALGYPQYMPLYVLALLLGRVALPGEIAPFGLALFAAVAAQSRDRSAAVGIAALAGAASAGFYQEAVIYLLSMLAYWRLADKLTLSEKKLQAVPLFLFGCVFLSGALLLPWRDMSIYGVLMVSLDALLCLVLTLVFHYGLPVFFERQYNPEALLVVAVMLAIAVAGLGSMTVYGYSLRNAAGFFIVMSVALGGGAGVGAAVGVITGMVIGISEGAAADAVALYAVAGMTGGILRELGKPAVMLGFMLGSAVAVLYLGQPGQLLLVLTEAAAGGAAFMLVPAGRFRLWQEGCLAAEADDGKAAWRAIQSAGEKLTAVAAVFGDLAQTASSDQVVANQDSLKQQQAARLLTAVGGQLCENCARRDDCWDKNYTQTYQDMLAMLALAEDGRLKPSTLPAAIKTCCMSKSALVAIIRQVAVSNQLQRQCRQKLAECRQVFAEQLQASGVIVGNLVQELHRGPKSDSEAAQLLAERAAALDCPLSSIEVISKPGKVVVTAQKTACDGTRECANTILPVTANLLQEKMKLQADCGSKLRHKNCKLTLELAERFQVETGVAAIAKAASQVSGDTCVVQPVGQGRTALILSDGMGSGEAAAAGSGKAVSFLQRLLAAGFDIGMAVKLVNSMLLINMPADTFATVDMVIVDTFTGGCEFLKVGSAPSYIKRVREVMTINPGAPPIGILEQVEIEPVRRLLVPGDIVVMVSDGVTEAGRSGDKEGWVANFLRRTGSERPQDIADRLLRQAIQLSGGTAKDDMAVLVARLAERPVPEIL